MTRFTKDRKDAYYRKAKEDGFRARSAYKLIHIDEIYDIMIRKRRFSRKRKRKDSIEEKISDINYIRGLTQRYESWSPKWEEKIDLAKEDLTMDEIDLVQYELRRISKKHRHHVFKQKI